jgi:hypothetical protein
VNPSPATSSSNDGEDRAIVLGITGGRVREGVMRVQTGERERESSGSTLNRDRGRKRRETEGGKATSGLAIDGRRATRHKGARDGENGKKRKGIRLRGIIVLIGLLGGKEKVEETARCGEDRGGARLVKEG